MLSLLPPANKLFSSGASSAVETRACQGQGNQHGHQFQAHAPVIILLDIVCDSMLMLLCSHTYMPKVLVDFAGPSYFGGPNNELVLCAGKG